MRVFGDTVLGRDAEATVKGWTSATRRYLQLVDVPLWTNSPTPDEVMAKLVLTYAKNVRSEAK